MPVLAACVPYYVNTDGPTTIRMNVAIAGMMTGNPVNKSVLLSGIDITGSQNQIQAAITNAIRADLIANNGYVFGGGDTVLMVGGS